MSSPRSRLGNQRRPVCRRPGIIPGRRFVLALLLVGLGGSAGVAAADENAGQQVLATVYAPGQAAAPDRVSIGALEADSSQCQPYGGPTLDFTGPTGDATLPPTSWPLASVLHCLATPVATTAVTDIEVQRQDGSFEAGSDSLLTHDDVNPPGDFSVADEVPVISSDGSNIIYNRPKRNLGDDNQADIVTVSDPSPFVIDVYEGPPLTVTVNASSATVAVGATVTFTATVSGPEATGLTYNWNFGGGTSNPNSTSPTPAETFETQGTYLVTVEVGDAAGGGGTASASITVGPTPPAGGGAHGRPGGGNTNSGSPKGPVNSHGHHVGGPAGKSKANGTPNTTPANGKSNPSGQTGSPSKTPAQRAPATRNGSSGTPRSPAPTPRFNPAQAPLITGRLVSDVRLLSPDASPFVHTVPPVVATAPAARRAIHASLLPALAGVLATLVLFALGARRELGGARARRGRRERGGRPGWRGLHAGG